MVDCSRVETLSSRLKHDCPPVEIIQHKSKKRRSKINDNDYNSKSDILNHKAEDKINLKKLQNEIIKFTNHFDGQNTKAKEQLAIKLGAKPRKKDHMNYKQLKEKLKLDAVTKKNQEQLFKLPKTMVRTSKSNKKPHMKKSKHSVDIIKNYGTIKNKK